MAKGKKTKKNESIWKWVLYVSGGIILTLVFVLGIVWWNMEGSKTDLEKRGFEDRGLPVVDIKLNGVSLEEIEGGNKETKYEGNGVFVYDMGTELRYEEVELKGRGNTTWEQEKKPYQLKFDRNVELLGLGKAKKWVLLANYLDASYLRNDLALFLAEMVGVQYNHQGRFVELYFNGEYKGLYYLVQKIEVAKGSVDLKNQKGILFEMDFLHRNSQEQCYTSFLNECLIYKESVVKDEKDNVINEFLDDFNNAEKAIMSDNFEEGAKLLDIDSFVKYFLINEFTVNPDAYSTSFYLYRNNDGKIAAGPVWDFDFAFANREWWADEGFFSPYETMVRRKNAFGHGSLDEEYSISKLMYYLMGMPEFKDEVNRAFRERMSGREKELIYQLDSTKDAIYRAAKIDEEKWKGKDFEQEVVMLRDWIKKRYGYFEKVYGENGTTIESF